MEDEEYLTISSTLEPSHNLPANITPESNLSDLSSQIPRAFQNPNLSPNIPASPISFPSDSPTTCPLAHPSQPLTTQPPKAKDHPIQQGLLPSQYKAAAKNIRPTVPPPQPPSTPITAQIIASVPPCAGTSEPMLLSIAPPSPRKTQPREQPEKKRREYKDDNEEELDEEEEESRRKVCDLRFALYSNILQAGFLIYITLCSNFFP